MALSLVWLRVPIQLGLSGDQPTVTSLPLQWRWVPILQGLLEDQVTATSIPLWFLWVPIPMVSQEVIQHHRLRTLLSQHTWASATIYQRRLHMEIHTTLRPLRFILHLLSQHFTHPQVPQRSNLLLFLKHSTCHQPLPHMTRCLLLQWRAQTSCLSRMKPLQHIYSFSRLLLMKTLMPNNTTCA